MFEGLDGKSAIVTGGATLIGAGVVEAFRRAGTRVAVADIDVERGRALARRLGDGVLFVETDLTDDARLAECVARAAQAHGGVHFLVNLACTYLDQGIESDRADWLRAFDVNVASAAMAARAVRPRMAAGGGGAIVNFTSISAGVAQTGRWIYPVCKAALAQLTRNLALDLAADGIRVNSVSPGWTWSAIMEQLTGGDRAMTDRVAAPFHILGRTGDPAEVAQVVLFLCSSQASFVTGADWACDGGYSALGPEGREPAIARLTA